MFMFNSTSASGALNSLVIIEDKFRKVKLNLSDKIVYTDI